MLGAAWREAAAALGLDADAPASLRQQAVRDRVLGQLHELLHSFPGYAQVRAVWLALEPWTIENGLITPTLKLKRPEMERRFASAVADLYAGHIIPA